MVSCGGQDARQGRGWLSAERGRALGQQSQQRRPGCRKQELVGREKGAEGASQRWARESGFCGP